MISSHFNGKISKDKMLDRMNMSSRNPIANSLG